MRTKRFPVYRESLRLIVNALCFITAYPEDIEVQWPQATPKKLLSKTVGTFRESRRTKSKLASLGYIPIHLCGLKIRKIAAEESAFPKKPIQGHWRRGHWRNQAHGPKLQLHKLIWIMPVMVNTTDEPAMGHLYLAS